MRCIFVAASLMLASAASAQETPRPTDRSTASLLFRSILGVHGDSRTGTARFSSAPTADVPIAKAYLLRGFYGVFSTGLDDIARELQTKDGLPCRVDQHTAYESLARSIADEHRRSRRPPLIVLVGHSYGADDAVQLTRKLKEANVPVALLATIDPVAPHKVPSNVNTILNLYKSKKAFGFVPAWRGVPLEGEIEMGDDLRNIDIRDHPGLDGPNVSHSTIDDQPAIQQAIVDAIRKVVRKE